MARRRGEVLKQWSRARERCCMLISPPSACLPRSLLPPAPSSTRRPPACGAPSFPAGPPPPASRSLAFPRVLPAAGEPHPGWTAERSPHGAPGTQVRGARLPGRPAGVRTPGMARGPEQGPRPRDTPGSKKEPEKLSQTQCGRPPPPVPRPELNLHPYRLPALVRTAAPRSPELLARSSPPKAAGCDPRTPAPRPKHNCERAL